MSNQENQNKPLLRKIGRFFIDLAKALGRGFKNNWAWKLTAVILAIILWGGLISQDRTLTRPKTFTDVPINLSGLIDSDRLLKERNGVILTDDILENTPTVNITVDIPVAEYNNVTEKDFDIKILSSMVLDTITAPGTYALKLTAGSTSKGTVTQIKPNTIEVEVEEYSTFPFPVTVKTKGVVKDDLFVTKPVPEPATVRIYGPKSIISKISQVAVTVDLSLFEEATGKANRSWPFSLLTVTKEGKEVELSDKEMSFLEVKDNNQSVGSQLKLNSIHTSQEVYPQRKLAVDLDMQVITGTPAEGYELGDVTIQPDTVIAYGEQTALDLFNNIYVKSENFIDITDEKSDNFSQVQKQRNKSVAIMNDTGKQVTLIPETLTVSYTIEPIMKQWEIEKKKIELQGLNEEYAATITNNIDNSALTVYGPVLWLNTLKEGNVKLYLDLDGLGVGSHSVPVKYVIDNDEADQVYHEVELNVKTVTVVITEK